MEKIKKTIKQSLILEKENDSFIIKPNLNTFYNIKILLKNEVNNLGFFNYYIQEK